MEIDRPEPEPQVKMDDNISGLNSFNIDLLTGPIINSTEKRHVRNEGRSLLCGIPYQHRSKEGVFWRLHDAVNYAEASELLCRLQVQGQGIWL